MSSSQGNLTTNIGAAYIKNNPFPLLVQNNTGMLMAQAIQANSSNYPMTMNGPLFHHSNQLLNAVRAQATNANLPGSDFSTGSKEKTNVGTLNAAATKTVIAEEDDDVMPWDDDPGWVPVTAKGNQKSPNQIRNQLQRYLDSCGRSKKDVMEEMGVKNNSFYKFMNPKTYKDQWSATQNESYWAAAKFLAKLEHDKKTTSTKRKASISTKADGAAKKPKTTESRSDAEAWMEQVMSTTGAEIDIVYDSCPQIIQKIKKCLSEHPGISKASFCKVALQGLNANSLAKFLASKKQDQQGNAAYKRAYAFFEKLRTMNGEPKSKDRLKNEEEEGEGGFETTPARKFSCIYVRGEEAKVQEWHRQHLQRYTK